MSSVGKACIQLIKGDCLMMYTSGSDHAQQYGSSGETNWERLGKTLPYRIINQLRFFRGIKSKKIGKLTLLMYCKRSSYPLEIKQRKNTFLYISLIEHFEIKKNHLYAAIFHQAMFDFQRLPGLVNVATSLWKITMLYHAI